MSVIAKVVTLLRGSAREIGESVIDANATRIYEQEVLDAKANIDQAKSELTGVVAKQMQSARAITQLQAEIARYEGLAVQALDKAQEPLALEVAAKVSALEAELSEQTKAHASYTTQVARLKELIQAAEARVREHEREVAIAKTTESVYRATRSISDNIGAGSSNLSNARQSLERIKQRHQDLSDRMTAAKDLDAQWGAGALDKKLAEAGIGPTAERDSAVLERIRAAHAARQAGKRETDPA